MLGWAITFLVVAVIAGLFGFGVIASAFAGIAQMIFFAFVVLFALSLIFGSVRSVVRQMVCRQEGGRRRDRDCRHSSVR